MVIYRIADKRKINIIRSSFVTNISSLSSLGIWLRTRKDGPFTPLRMLRSRLQPFGRRFSISPSLFVRPRDRENGITTARVRTGSTRGTGGRNALPRLPRGGPVEPTQRRLRASRHFGFGSTK